MATYLIDGTTELPENGDTGWGTTLNAAINSIDGRFTWTGGEAVVNKVVASGITGTTLPATLVNSSLTSVGTLTSLSVSGAVTIGGNLTVNGTTTTINTATLNVSDNVVVLNNDVTGTPTENAGIEVERGDSTNVVIRWNETSDKWELTNDGSSYGNIVTTGDSGTVTATMIANDAVALGTQTTGNYVADVTAGTGITVTHTPGEGSSPTIAVTSNTYQPLDTELTALAGLTSAADSLPYFTGSGTASLATFTSAARNLLDDATTTDMLLTLNLGITSSVHFGTLRANNVNVGVTAANEIDTVSGDLTIDSAGGTVTIDDNLTVTGTTVLGPSIILDVVSTTYTLALTDQGKILETTNGSGCVVTVPPESSVNFPVGSQVTTIRNTANSVSFAAGAGVTIRSDSSKFYIATQYSAATLVKRGSDEWYLFGNLSAS